MTRKYIYGASAKSRLVLDFLSTEHRRQEIQGIIDSDLSKKESLFHGVRVVGTLDDLSKSKNLSEKVSICVSLSERNFKARTQVYDEISQVGFDSLSILSLSANISNTAIVQKGSIVFPGVQINASAHVGTCVTIYTGALIEHDCFVADNVEISPRSVLAGGVQVETEVFIGIGATILPFVRIGRNAIVGAGSVVTKDVAPYSVVAGNPARVLKIQER